MQYRFILMFLLAGVLFQSAMADEIAASKRDDIKRLMQVTGSANVATQFASAGSKQIFQILKASRPEIPDRALVVMDRELVALFSEKMSTPGGLLDQVIPIYDKYFTHDEIRQLLAFYETPLGKKAISVLPKVVNESMLAGQSWGQSLGPEIERRIGIALKREGLLPKEQ